MSPFDSRPDRGVPLLDSGEQTRLDYWREHSRALPRELLEITGWLSREPDRRVSSQVDGRVAPVRAAEAANAVFRVPETGPARERWHEYLEWMRRELSNRRYKARALQEATARKSSAEQALKDAASELKRTRNELADAQVRNAEVTEQARLLTTALLERSRAGTRPTPEEVAEAARLVRLTHDTRDVDIAAEKLRNLQSKQMALEQQLQAAQDLVHWREQRAASRELIGLFGEINAFLDLQALSVASVASEEFRHRPRPHVASAAEVEAAMERDDGA